MSLSKGFRILLCFSFLGCAQASRINLDASSNAGLLLQGGFNFVFGSNGNELTAFEFPGVENYLVRSYPGVVTETEIAARVPFGATKRLKAAFTVSPGAYVFVNGIQQISGVTENDFSSPVIYMIVAGNGNVRSYTVNVGVFTPISDAGQVECSDDSLNTIPCGNTTFPGQDGDYAGIAPSFQRVGADPVQPVVYDKNTGLIWKLCRQGTNAVDCTALGATAMTYSNAVNSCAALNDTAYAGIRTWRLPDIRELFTLASYDRDPPYIDVAVFPDGNNQVWSGSKSDPLSSTPSRWTLNFSTGNNQSSFESVALGVRCVSGGEYPVRSFIDRGDGTVFDQNTDLLWQKCMVGKAGDNCQNVVNDLSFSWQTALTNCDTLNLAGLHWRMPNVREYLSIVRYDLPSGTTSIDETAFPNTQTNTQYWMSNTNHYPGNEGAFMFDIGYAFLSSSDPIYSQSVRCVTDAPVSQ
ncbi:DUF1566 domain-containing protein [Leptospira gomenensis]|uniref:DUF1566 domain-containing protein n=1 Tax=Leptospira gomenensis TaxID=2484974 RepID=A0A5F1YSU2_9LEPT|nr:DUF1566 domain-containing protein [Leptospira gomenensis]TGK33804.1 DUF1566 domain-containing protein [Leptospira gomenensis]TGK36373.1 DUF1566 domain-containing protein [Leptospira gomenensis]TGK47397.1 DUF1566 domain-containing protein [Leptospira gomenensis]TGK60654.1 DUF1566 domain-containing protein [Leptospira gomenensis]